MADDREFALEAARAYDTYSTQKSVSFVTVGGSALVQNIVLYIQLKDSEGAPAWVNGASKHTVQVLLLLNICCTAVGVVLTLCLAAFGYLRDDHLLEANPSRTRSAFGSIVSLGGGFKVANALVTVLGATSVTLTAAFLGVTRSTTNKQP